MENSNKLNKDIIIIKIGGVVIEDKNILLPLIDEVLELKKRFRIIIVHGGGKEVSRVSTHFGFKPVFEKGVRITTHDEMEIVNMVLSGKINKYIVRCFNKSGSNSVGLNGQDARLFTGRRLDKTTCTGEICRTDISFLSILLSKGIIPVIASISMDDEGKALNINADEAAFKIAEAIRAEKLLFISDIPGILKNNRVMKTVNEQIILDETDSGIIKGGMIPKTGMSIRALKNGVNNIIIGQYTGNGGLSPLLSGEKGTTIKL